MLANDWGNRDSSADTKRVAQGEIVMCDYNINSKSKLNQRIRFLTSKIIHKQRNGPTDQDTLKEGSTMRTTKVLQDNKLNRRKLK
jgi:hypothetical protein